jgi:hypothetical protein
MCFVNTRQKNFPKYARLAISPLAICPVLCYNDENTEEKEDRL